MKNMPTLLVHDEMIASIDEQIAEMKKFSIPTPANFLYVFSLCEGLLRELSFQLYYAFPKKLKGLDKDSDNADGKCEIEKDKLLLTNDYYFVLNSIIDKKLFKIGKESLYGFLHFFINHSGITLVLNESLLSNMTKARNFIAHCNAYKIKPWNIESAMFSDILNESNLQNYIEYIEILVETLKSEISKKYSKYTYERLLLDSWNYTCPNQISIYDVFDFSNGIANIQIEKAIKTIQNVSSSEKYLISIWLENYNIEVMYKIMSKVGKVNSSAHICVFNELRYLHQLFREYPYLVNGQSYNVKNGKMITD